MKDFILFCAPRIFIVTLFGLVLVQEVRIHALERQPVAAANDLERVLKQVAAPETTQSNMVVAVADLNSNFEAQALFDGTVTTGFFNLRQELNAVEDAAGVQFKPHSATKQHNL